MSERLGSPINDGEEFLLVCDNRTSSRALEYCKVFQMWELMSNAKYFPAFLSQIRGLEKSMNFSCDSNFRCVYCSSLRHHALSQSASPALFITKNSVWVKKNKSIKYFLFFLSPSNSSRALSSPNYQRWDEKNWLCITTMQTPMLL